MVTFSEILSAEVELIVVVGVVALLIVGLVNEAE